MIKDKDVGTIIPIPYKDAYDAEREAQANVIGSRIYEARKAKKMSCPKLTERLSLFGVKVTRQSVAKWEKGQSMPNAYQLIAVCHALDIQEGLDYFTRAGSQKEQDRQSKEELNAEGQRKVAEYKADLIATGLYKPRKTDTRPRIIVSRPSIRYIEVDISTLAASAGTGDFLDASTFEKVSFPENAVPAKADFGIRVHGDSMEPVYHDGQIVWVQRCEDLEPGEVGVFAYDGNGYLKMYDEREPDGEDAEMFIGSDGAVHMQPVLVSYNEKYDPIPVSPHAAFRIAGRVLN